MTAMDWNDLYWGIVFLSPFIISIGVRVFAPQSGAPWKYLKLYFWSALGLATTAIIVAVVNPRSDFLSHEGAGSLAVWLFTVPIGVFSDVIAKRRRERGHLAVASNPDSQRHLVTLSQSEYMRMTQESSSAFSEASARHSDQ